MAAIEDESAGNLFAGAFTVLAACAVGIVTRGLVLTKLWLWFIASTFGLPTLGIATALGISVTVSYMTNASSSETKKFEKDEELGKVVTRCIAQAIGTPLGVLLLGWIIHQFQ